MAIPTHATSTPPAPPVALRTSRWVGLLLLLGFSILYLYTLDNGLQPGELEGGDLITHQYAQVQARPSNAPGYPLYTMGGWLWFHGWRGALRASLQSVPNPIPLLSSYSTLFALLGLGLLYVLGLRLTRSVAAPAGRWDLAAAISTFYGLTYFFWYYATTTEQYSSAVAHTLAIVWLYVKWQEAAHADEERAKRLLLWLALLCGISLAHMVTVALVVPPLVGVILWQRPDYLRRPRLVILAVAAAAAPLTSYLYVYLQGVAHPEWWGEGTWPTGAAWFWSFVATAQGQDELSWGLEPGRPVFTESFPALIGQELSIPLLILGAWGIALLNRRLAVLLYATLVLYLLLGWVDRFGNWFQVVMPAYPLVLLGLLPLGARAAFALGRHRQGLGAIPALLLVAACVWRLDASWPAVDSRDRPGDTALARPVQLLAEDLPVGAAVFAEKSDALGLAYLTQIWGLRPDVRVVSSPKASALLAADEPVFVTWQAAPLLRSEVPAPAPLPAGVSPNWVALSRQPLLQPSPEIFLGLDAGEGIVLEGARLAATPRLDGDHNAVESDVTLYWSVRSDAAPAEWSISVRPYAAGERVRDGAGVPVQSDRPGPVHGLRPFSSLAAGSVVADGYRLPVAPEAMDELLVILYRPDGEGRFTHLAELRVPVSD